ncbi:hypothetical protein [Rhodococcus sp. Eu-32]|uniref:hypothetical protein n=1 Tax=Rhodococcus sp. Eu-32 TaxID=1017319 RepID=UPI001A9DB91D|nr:hypothetical protein [Rhodococcus sp. Eu-32]
MTSSNTAPVSARERARAANAQRLADAQSRLKSQEQDLISYFDATRDEDKVADDLAKRVARLQCDADAKLESARRRRADALAALKARGETYSSIAALVDLPVPETTKLVKSVLAAGLPADTEATVRQRERGAVGADNESTAEAVHSSSEDPQQISPTDARDIA